MDRLSVDEEFDQEVLEAMREHGIDREEAFLLVALRRGEVHGDGDLVCVRRLSPDERRLIGLDRDPEQIIADDLDYLSKEASLTEPATSVGGADVPAVPAGVRRP